MMKTVVILALSLTTVNLAMNGYIAYHDATSEASTKQIEVACFKTATDTVCLTS